MFDLALLFDFSRTNCAAICAFLVPANLLATLQTLVFVGAGRSPRQVRWMTGAASVYAMLMILHVATWLVIGVVMLPTFILLGLGSTCLCINAWAIAHPHSMKQILQFLWQWGRSHFTTAFGKVSIGL